MDAANPWLDLWELAKTAGPFGTVFALLIWYRADTERRQVQARLDALVERTLGTMGENTANLRELSQLLSSTRRVTHQ